MQVPSGRTIIPQPKQFVYLQSGKPDLHQSFWACVCSCLPCPRALGACNDAHGAALSSTVCGLIANRRSVGISCATMQHVETPKDVSGIVAIPSGFESARRSASV